MKKKYTIAYFIAKFEHIPANQFTTGAFVRDGRCCALGFCGYTRDARVSTEGRTLDKLLGYRTTQINDNELGRYSDLGDTPKDRILNALSLASVRRLTSAVRQVF